MASCAIHSNRDPITYHTKGGGLDHLAPKHCRRAPRAPYAADATLSALVQEAERWRQMTLVSRTPRLLAEAREAREAAMLPRGCGAGAADADLARFVLLTAFGFAHCHQPSGGT